jgi:hypothetical protein
MEPIMRFWLVQWSCTVVVYGKATRSHLFRIFTRFGSLLTSIQRGIHPCWSTNYDIYYIMPDNEPTNVTSMCQREAILHNPTEEELEEEEPNCQPQHSQEELDNGKNSTTEIEQGEESSNEESNDAKAE